MSQESTLRRTAETSENFWRHWEARRTAIAAATSFSPIPHSFTVALSREAGTRGTAVAEEVGERLKWHVYDQELLGRIAQDMGVRTSLLESVDERHMSWLLEALEGFMAVPAVSESAYVRNLVETVLALGTHGECLIVGRGAAFILPAETTLRVRLVAPLNDRIAVMRQSLSGSQHEVSRQVETIDREHVRFVKDHFHRDAADARQYDLVLNTSRFSVIECAELVIEALRRRQARLKALRPPRSRSG